MESTGKRIGWEFLIVLLLLVVVVGVWWWQGRVADREVARVRAETEQQVRAVEQDARQWAEALAASEAEAAFRAFAAGVAPLILAGERQAVDQALGGLLELSSIAFVHVLAPDGGVIASSDRKLTTTGLAGPGAEWALGSTGLATRAGDQPGITELAAPVVGPAGPAAYLWLGYDTGRLVESARPESLTPAEAV